MKGVRLNMQLVAISSGPKERGMTFLCPSNVNKATEILQATQNLTANMIFAMHKDLMRMIKNKICCAKHVHGNNKCAKMAINWMFFQV
jgi:hypothetical protein